MLSGFIFPDRNSDTSWAALLLNRGPHLSFIYSPWVVSESSYVSKIAFDSLQFLSYLHFCLVSLSFGHAGKNSEKNNRSACPCFLFKFLILPYSWHKTIKRYVIWGPSRWKPVIINRQVNRATPVVITHRCQALVSAVPASPREAPAESQRSCSCWGFRASEVADPEWCTNDPQTNLVRMALICSSLLSCPNSF